MFACMSICVRWLGKSTARICMKIWKNIVQRMHLRLRLFYFFILIGDIYYKSQLKSVLWQKRSTVCWNSDYLELKQRRTKCVEEAFYVGVISKNVIGKPIGNMKNQKVYTKISFFYVKNVLIRSKIWLLTLS